MQVPPAKRRSTIATRRPAPAILTASAGPAWPAPMTTSSKRSAVMRAPPRRREDIAAASSISAAGRSRPNAAAPRARAAAPP